MNITGKYMKTWKIEDKGNFKLVDLGDSYKVNGEYKNFTWFRCAFVGEAAKKQLNEKDTIEVTNGLIKQEEYQGKWYTKVTIFDFNIMGQQTKQEPKQDNNDFNGFQNLDDGSDECPF